uniref:Uncharacterized protein n=1 Tax=Oryza barthii TaxID=65489 RepID=A0A0D3GTS8_9ORYZ
MGRRPDRRLGWGYNVQRATCKCNASHAACIDVHTVIKDMPRRGNPDADLVLRVVWEIGYLCASHRLSHHKTHSFCGLLLGAIYLTWNTFTPEIQAKRNPYKFMNKKTSPVSLSTERYR